MDGQVIIDVILVILLVGGFIVYFRAKKQLRAGNRSGWLKWAEPYVSVTRSEPSKPPAAPAPDVLGALDELYREFVDETADIRREFAEQLNQLRREMDVKLAEQAARVSAAPRPSGPVPQQQSTPPLAEPTVGVPEVDRAAVPVVPTPDPAPAPEYVSPSAPANVSVQPPSSVAAPPGEQTMAHRRFEILELLVQGLSETEIARKLGIGVAEVNLVQQLLKQPR